MPMVSELSGGQAEYIQYKFNTLTYFSRHCNTYTYTYTYTRRDVPACVQKMPPHLDDQQPRPAPYRGIFGANGSLNNYAPSSTGTVKRKVHNESLENQTATCQFSYRLTASRSTDKTPSASLLAPDYQTNCPIRLFPSAPHVRDFEKPNPFLKSNVIALREYRRSAIAITIAREPRKLCRKR